MNFYGKYPSTTGAILNAGCILELLDSFKQNAKAQSYISGLENCWMGKPRSIIY